MFVSFVAGKIRLYGNTEGYSKSEYKTWISRFIALYGSLTFKIVNHKQPTTYKGITH